MPGRPILTKCLTVSRGPSRQSAKASRKAERIAGRMSGSVTVARILRRNVVTILNGSLAAVSVVLLVLGLPVEALMNHAPGAVPAAFAAAAAISGVALVLSKLLISAPEMNVRPPPITRICAEGGVTVASIKIGDKVITSFDKGKAGAQAAAQEKTFTDAATAAIRGAGYPASADKAKVNMPMVILLLTILVIYVTMVYGPIAAMLVELFPTRIRYSGMSLPYHIGNGWFGGFLPPTAFAIVAATGNIYSGLWYPIAIAGMTFVIGLLFVPETKDRDIYHGD